MNAGVRGDVDETDRTPPTKVTKVRGACRVQLQFRCGRSGLEERENMVVRVLSWIGSATVSFALLAAGDALAGDVVVEISGLKLSRLSSRSPVLITLHGVAPGRYAVTAQHGGSADPISRTPPSR